LPNLRSYDSGKIPLWWCVGEAGSYRVKLKNKARLTLHGQAQQRAET